MLLNIIIDIIYIISINVTRKCLINRKKIAYIQELNYRANEIQKDAKKKKTKIIIGKSTTINRCNQHLVYSDFWLDSPKQVKTPMILFKKQEKII